MATLYNGDEHAGKRLASRSASLALLSSVTVDKKKLKTETLIGLAFHSLDLDIVAKHFCEVSENEDDDVIIDIEPYILCKNVSIEDYNAYVGDGSTQLPVSPRFLELRAGDLLIIDWPTRIHESVIRNFEYNFIRAFGNGDAIAKGGSFTARRGGNPSKEADATFGPLRNTPHRQNPPAGIGIGEWTTLAVEVAISQDWLSLENAALWWASYPGVEYIVCIKVSPQGRRWRYRLYSINQLGILPAPQVDQEFLGVINVNSHTLAFDARRILAIPAAQPLPDGVNAQIVVDLFHIANVTRQSI